MRLERIQPLTEFQRNTRQFVSDLKETGEPLVLTINGKAELVVLDSRRYQALMDELAAAEVDRLLAERIEASQHDDGSTVPGAFDRIEARLRKARTER